MDTGIWAAIITALSAIVVQAMRDWSKKTESVSMPPPVGQATLSAPQRVDRAKTETRRSQIYSLVSMILMAIAIIFAFGSHQLLAGRLDVESKVTPPIGSIIAWHKNPNLEDSSAVIASKPPDGWLECDGKSKIPEDSDLFKLGVRTTPNLNKADGYVGGRFLRGGEASGIRKDCSLHYYQTSYEGVSANTIPNLTPWITNPDKVEPSTAATDYEQIAAVDR